MAENIDLQISVLTRLWTRQLAEVPPTVTAEQLRTYASGAAAIMVDGAEVIGVAFEGGSTNAVVPYPKYVVMAAALDVLDKIDADDSDGSPVDPDVTHFDLSKGRIET